MIYIILIIAICNDNSLFFNSPYSVFQIDGELERGELDRSIDEVMRQRKYAWRMPREKASEPQREPGMIESAIKWIIDKIESAIKTLRNWIRKLSQWVNHIFPDELPKREISGFSWRSSVRILLIILLGLLCVLLGIFLFRLWKRRNEEHIEITATPVFTAPDLEKNSILPDELSYDQWMNLARDMFNKGSFRAAFRANFLGIMAYLAEHQMITIAAYKSNRDYERELMRELHQHPEIVKIFSEQVKLFDRIWYGMYDLRFTILDLRSEFSELKNYQN